MAKLADLSEGYMDAAVRLRLALEEARSELEQDDGSDRTALERRVRILRQMLQEMRDLRGVTRGYYTRARDGRYTTSTLRAPRKDGLG